MVSYVLQSGIMSLIRNGAVEMIIFALVFAITYGIFRKIHLFAPGKDKGERDKNLQKMKPVHSIMSLAFALLVIIPHHMAPGSSYDIVPVIEKSFPQLSFLLVAALCALILLGFFGMSLGRHSSDKNPIKGIVFVISIGFIVWIFGSNMNWWRNPWASLFTPDIVAVIIAVLVFAMVISFIMGNTEKKYTWDKYFENEKSPDWKKAKIAHQLHDFMRGKKLE